MANVGPFTWYVRDNAPTSTVGWSAVTAWATGATIAAGALRRQLATPAVNSERVFVCIVAGTTHATTEPTWVLTKGAKTTDNTVTWQECTGQPGVNGDVTNSPTWLQNINNAVTLGMIIRNAAGTFLFICTTAGTTGNGAEPTWNTTAGVTTADNTVTWTSLGAVGNFAAWAAPFARLAPAFAATWGTAGSSFYVADDHAETQAATMTLSTPGIAGTPCNVLCISHTGSLPATSLTTGASISQTGNFTYGVSTGYCYWHGIKFSLSAGANAQAMSIAVSVGGGSSDVVFKNCAFASLNTVNSVIQMGTITANRGARVVWDNCTVQFGHTASSVVPRSIFVWKNTPSAIVGATIPAALFTSAPGASSAAPGGIADIRGVDLSAITGALVTSGSELGLMQYVFTDCKLGAGVAMTASAPNVSVSMEAASNVDVLRSDSAATTYQSQRSRFQGTQVTETVVIRTGGASNGTTGVSFKIVTTAYPLWVIPFDCFQIGIWNAVTGSNVTCTVCGIWNGAALPNNDQVWTDIEYLGSASSPLASFASGTKASILATGAALAADTSAWDGQATARANTTAYVLGQTIKLATNPGRLFFCTTAGTSAGSEPGGYASAVDGGSVTDNTAIFQAGFRFKMVVTLNSPQPQLAGDLYAIVRAALPSSTFWIDPLITLT